MINANRVVIFKFSKLFAQTHRYYAQQAKGNTDRLICLDVRQSDLSVGPLRLDKFLTDKYGLSWSSIHKLIRKRKIRLKAQSPLTAAQKDDLYKYMLQPGDKLFIHEDITTFTTKNENTSSQLDLESVEFFKQLIIYECSNFIVINKLSGISSQGGSKVIANLSPLVKAYLLSQHSNKEERIETSGELDACHINQRLDKCTSGAMVVAKKRQFAVHYANLLQKRLNIEKIYVGVVEGIPLTLLTYLKAATKPRLSKLPLEFSVDEPLDYDDAKHTAILSNRFDGDGKDCMTQAKVLGFVKIKKSNKTDFKLDYRLISNDKLLKDTLNLQDVKLLRDKDAFFDDVMKRGSIQSEHDSDVYYQTIMQFRIWAGRKHQIRAHSALVLKTPILNDTRYGSYQTKLLNLDAWWSQDKALDVANDPDQMCFDEEDHKISERKTSEIHQSFERKTVKRGDLHFLHARRLTFPTELDNSRKALFVAGFPTHFNWYFSSLFGNKKSLPIIKNF